MVNPKSGTTSGRRNRGGDGKRGRRSPLVAWCNCGRYRVEESGSPAQRARLGVKIKLDENLAASARQVLAEFGADVETVVGEGLGGRE
jgi:hypothetical protein